VPGTPELSRSDSSARTKASTTKHSQTSQGGVISSAATTSASQCSQTQGANGHGRYEPRIAHADSDGGQQTIGEPFVSGLQPQRIDTAFAFLGAIELRTERRSQHEHLIEETGWNSSRLEGDGLGVRRIRGEVRDVGSRLQPHPPPQRLAAGPAGRLPALAGRWNRLLPTGRDVPHGR
jgi:hypothetical protein